MTAKQALSNLKPYLKALDDGRLRDIDVNDFERQFHGCATQAGDHLQFKLHTYCQKDLKDEKDVSTIISLSKLCYSDKSIKGFSNMSRFLGCVYHITTFLLKQKKYEDALEVYESLSKVDQKSKEIKESALKSESIKKTILNIHAQFINSAISLLSEKSSNTETIYDTNSILSEKVSHDLALASIKVLDFMLENSVAPNIIRNMKIYFTTIKNYTDENAKTLFDEFMKCLKKLQPGFRETEFLCYYIFEMDRGESSTDPRELHAYFQRRIHLLLLFLNEIHLMEKWNVFLNFFLSEIKSLKNIQTALEALENIKKDGSDENLLVVLIVFNYSMQLWWKLHSEDWGEKFSVEFVKMLFDEIIIPLKCKLGNLTRFCGSSVPSMMICLSDLLISNLHKIFYTIRLCLKNNVSNSLELVDVLRRAFVMMKNSLEEMTKNKCCISRRQYSWNQGIIHYTNSIEDILRECTKVGTTWEYLRDCSKELLSEIMNSSFEIPYQWKRVVLLFQRWHHANMKLQDYKESLFVCAVYITAYSKDEEEALALWLQTKMQMSNQESEDITLVEVIRKNSNRIQELNSKYKKLAHEDIKKLLLMELKAYNSCSLSNFKKSSVSYDSANRIWAQLTSKTGQLKLDIHEKASALNCIINLTVNTGNSALIKNYLYECTQTLDKLIKKGKNNPRDLFYAGNLKFSIFQLNLKSIQQSEDNQNSMGMILDYLKTQEEEKAKFGDDIDLNLTCDILPSSINLNVKLNEKYLSALNDIVKIWREAAKSVRKESLEQDEIKSWLHNVKQVALMYQLVGDYYQGLRAWILYYNIAKIFEDTLAQLLGISYVLEECTHVDKCNLLLEAESIADEMAKTEKNRHVVVRYWLTMASKHLKQQNDSDCFRYLSRIKTELETLKIFNFYIYNGKFWCLLCHFLCLYPSYIEKFQFGSDVDMRAIIYKGFSFLNSGIKAEATKSFSQTEYTELLLTVIEVNMWAVEYFGLYQQTTFMRLFLEDLYQITQKLVLPTRIAEILVKLAEIDILCEKFDDCQIKLNKLKNILMIGSIQCVEPEKSVKEYLNVPRTHPEEAISPRPLSPVRFVDKDTKYRRERDVSPFASEIKRSETKFDRLNHPENCQCVSCQNILIQLLIIDTLTLDGKCLTKKSQLKKAYFCYRAACENLELIKSNLSIQNQKLTREIEGSVKQFTGSLDFKTDLTRFHSAKCLINYAFFKLSSEVKGDVMADVMSLIGKIDKILKTLTFEEKLLKWRFLELKLTALVLAKRETAKKPLSPVVNPRPIEYDSISTPMVSHVPKKNLEPNKYQNLKIAKTPRDSKTAGRKLLEESEDEEEEPKAGAAKNLETGNKEKAAAKIPGTEKKVDQVPRKYKNLKIAKTPRVSKIEGRKLLQESEDEDKEEAPAKFPEASVLQLEDEDEAAAAKKSENDVSVDLFESFEERLKLTEESKKKPKPMLKEKSLSVEIIDVRRSSRNRNKK